MSAEGLRGRDRNSELSRLVGLLARLGPDLNEIAAQLKVHKGTTRYWYNHLLLDRGFSLRAVPNYRKLGLERLILIAGLSPAFRPHTKKIFAFLHEQCYVKEVERTAVEGHFMVHVAVPTELAEPCASLFRQLKRMGVFSRLEVHRFSRVRTPPMMGDHYDFRNAVWTYDWRGNDKVPLVPVEDSERAAYDKVDLLILRELHENPNRKLWQISRRLGVGYRYLVWHHGSHVRSLIDCYALDWRSAKTGGDDGRKSEYLPVKVVLTGAHEGTTISLVALMQRLPFLWFEASGGRGYFASLYIPLEAITGFFSRLRDLEIEEPELRWYLTSQSSAEDYGVSYHLFEDPCRGWRLNKPAVIKSFENLIVEVRNS